MSRLDVVMAVLAMLLVGYFAFEDVRAPRAPRMEFRRVMEPGSAEWRAMCERLGLPCARE